jgi:mannose-6-phosphate isomerase-like protein (cupin superfamily)
VTAETVHAGLRKSHPISVEPGFEGNPNVEGGVWRVADGGDDALVHLRFAQGGQELPLHVHEYSDRLILVTSGMGLFHYLPGGSANRELRSVVVESGDVVIFTRGLIHTFTAPITDLTLLSYHSPFFELDDPRQYMIPADLQEGEFIWVPCAVVRSQAVSDKNMAPSNDFAEAVR